MTTAMIATTRIYTTVATVSAMTAVSTMTSVSTRISTGLSAVVAARLSAGITAGLSTRLVATRSVVAGSRGSFLVRSGASGIYVSVLHSGTSSAWILVSSTANTAVIAGTVTARTIAAIVTIAVIATRAWTVVVGASYSSRRSLWAWRGGLLTILRCARSRLR